jgi:hypothetical protein
MNNIISDPDDHATNFPLHDLEREKSATKDCTDPWKQIPFFEYLPLEDQYGIRLLHILPGAPEDILQCECVHYPSCRVSQTPEYTAISYTWGDLSQKGLILVNGRKHYITENAMDVLLYVRSEQDTRIARVWIDTICIDQSNVVERNHQVRLMGQIYSNAQQTVVWLGKESEDSDLAMDFIPLVDKTLKDFEGSESVIDYMFLQKLNTGRDSLAWEALGNLLARPWFQRVWVIQEVALSHTAYMVCGSKRLDWEHVGNMIENLYMISGAFPI